MGKGKGERGERGEGGRREEKEGERRRKKEENERGRVKWELGEEREICSYK